MAKNAAIEAQLGQLEVRHTLWNRGELRRLPEVIREDEKLHAVARCRLEGTAWLLVVTDQRLLFLHRRLFHGLRQIELPLLEIQSIQSATFLFRGEIVIGTANGTRRLERLRSRIAERLVAIVSRLLHAARRSGTAPPGRSSPVLDQLERLQRLRDTGALTEEEFQAQKKRIL